MTLLSHAQTPSFRTNTALRAHMDANATEESVQAVPPRAPSQFNPDPGQWNNPAGSATSSGANVEQGESDNLLLFPSLLPPEALQGENLDPRLKLPRRGVRGLGPVEQQWDYPKYPLGREGLGLFPHSDAVPNRWLLNFPHWKRYHDPSIETPYQYETPLLWHPYRQSILKGDVPIIGQDIFLDVTAKNFTLFEGRKLPVGSGVSANRPNSSEFFGRGDQFFISSDNSLSVDLFQGETGFKPVDWAVRLTAVQNVNMIWVRENNLLNPDPRGTDYTPNLPPPNSDRIQSITPATGSVNPKSGDPGVFTRPVNPGDVFNFIAPYLKPTGGARALVKVDPATNQPANGKLGKTTNNPTSQGSQYTYRQKDFLSLEEAFVEAHFNDISDNYDFVSGRFGIQPFNSDFRGFIFDDTNLGARIFGNLNNNHFQYNLAVFDMREKDTYSGLNEFDSRRQTVAIANIFKQDFFAKGYTAQFSIHGNFDDGGVHYDKNGFLTRPTPIGTVPLNSDGSIAGHSVNAVYLGWTGDGHIGRFNVTHAFYQVFGHDSYNDLAGHAVDVSAQMAALELSYDMNWLRFKLSGFYASGSADPTSHTATGFDSILDRPNFIGGPFSWYVHEAPNLAGTAVNLKQNDSLIPDFRSSKTEDQSNFVNPGVMILGAGIDADVTPKLRAFANVNYIWFAQTAPIKLALMTDQASRNFGLDTSIGVKYRPLLTDNIIVSAGIGLFFPGQGYKDIYRTNTSPIAGYGNQTGAGKVDPLLYNAFFTVTFTF